MGRPGGVVTPARVAPIGDGVPPMLTTVKVTGKLPLMSTEAAPLLRSPLHERHVALVVPSVTARPPGGLREPVPGLPGAEGRGAHPGAVGQIADRQGLRGSRFRGHAVEHNFNTLSKKVSTDNDNS